MNKAYTHIHYAAIFQNISRFFILLLIPIGRSLLVSGGFLQWLKGSWADFIILAFIITYSYAKWHCCVFLLLPDKIILRSGVFIKKKTILPFSGLSSFTVENRFWQRPFSAATLMLDTDAGTAKKADMQLIVSQKTARAFCDMVEPVFARSLSCPTPLKKKYRPKLRYVLLLSGVFSKSFAGVAFLVLFFNKSGRIIGQWFQQQIVDAFTSFSSYMAFGIPPLAATVGYILLIGWFFAFLGNLIKTNNFFAVKWGGCLKIKSGIFTLRTVLIRIDKINYVNVQQGLLTSIIGLCSVFIHCSGYGKKGGGIAVLIPACPKKSLSASMKIFFPDFSDQQPVVVRPEKRGILRYISLPLWLLAALILVIPIWFLWPSWRQLILFLAVMYIVPVLWLLLLRLLAFFRCGIGQSRDLLIAGTTRGYNLYKVYIPKRKIVLAQLRQNPFQKRGGLCDIVIYTNSEGRQKHVIKSLPLNKAKMAVEAYL